MTDPGVFAEYVSRYDESVQAVIGASGESVHFFAELKAHLTRQAIPDLEARAILDFGCGVGNTTRCLASAFPRARITGFDLSGPSVEAARSLSIDCQSSVCFVEGSGFGLPFDSNSFDVAIASCVFHHIPAEEHIAWAAEVLRVLRPGGAFLLFEHNPFNPLTRRVVHDCPFDRGVKLLLPAYTRRMLRTAGYRADRPKYYFFFPRMLRLLRALEPLLHWLPLGAQYYSRGWKPLSLGDPSDMEARVSVRVPGQQTDGRATAHSARLARC